MYGGQSTNASFGNSTIDWGFLGAISGRKNFDTLKQEKLREIALVQQQNSILQNRIAQQSAAEEGISQYLDTINNLKVLPEGLERIKEVDKTLRENVTKGIMDSKGDIRKWLMSGGTKVLNEYKKNLVNNEVTQREIGNAYQTNRWLADKQAGLQEEYNFDEKGQPYGFEQQYQKYKNGEIDSLNYTGAFKLPEYKSTIPERYAFIDKEKGKTADETDVYNDAYMQFKDLPEKQRRQAAWHKTMEYRQALQAGAAPYIFKVDQRDPLKDAEAYARINKLKWSTAKDKASIGALQQLQSRLQAIQNGQVPPDGNQPFVNTDNGQEWSIPYSNLDANSNEHTLDLAGFKVDKDGNFVESSKNLLKTKKMLSADGGDVDFSNVPDKEIKKSQAADTKIYYKEDANGKVVPYRLVRTIMTEKGAEAATFNGKPIEGESWGQSNINKPPLSKREGLANGWSPINDGMWEINTLVPIFKNVFTDPYDKKQYSTKEQTGIMIENTDDGLGTFYNNYINLMQGNGEE